MRLSLDQNLLEIDTEVMGKPAEEDNPNPLVVAHEAFGMLLYLNTQKELQGFIKNWWMQIAEGSKPHVYKESCQTGDRKGPMVVCF